jgi:hypothetical protein
MRREVVGFLDKILPDFRAGLARKLLKDPSLNISIPAHYFFRFKP